MAELERHLVVKSEAERPLMDPEETDYLIEVPVSTLGVNYPGDMVAISAEFNRLYPGLSNLPILLDNPLYQVVAVQILELPHLLLNLAWALTNASTASLPPLKLQGTERSILLALKLLGAVMEGLTSPLMAARPHPLSLIVLHRLMLAPLLITLLNLMNLIMKIRLITLKAMTMILDIVILHRLTPCSILLRCLWCR